jgi:hypothetical protein
LGIHQQGLTHISPRTNLHRLMRSRNYFLQARIRKTRQHSNNGYGNQQLHQSETVIWFSGAEASQGAIP